MDKPKKCPRCNLYTKKNIDFCPKCGRKLIPTKDFEYPIGFKDHNEGIGKEKSLIEEDKKKLKRLTENEEKIQEQVKEMEKEKKGITEEKLKLEIKKKEEEKKLAELRKKELERIKAQKKRFKEEKAEESESTQLNMDLRKTSKLPLVIAATFILVAFLVIFVIPFPYSATEEYVDTILVDVQVPKTIMKDVKEVQMVPEQVPTYNKKCDFQASKMANPTNWLVALGSAIMGQDPNDAFEECYQDTSFETIQKPIEVIKQVPTIIWVTEKQPKQIVKTRSVSKYAILFNQWAGKRKYYFKVGES